LETIDLSLVIAQAVLDGFIGCHCALCFNHYSHHFFRRCSQKNGIPFWKNLHLVSYATAALFLIHGLFMDPLLKDRPTDFIDAEKAFSEICLLVILVAAFCRYRYFQQHQKSA